MSRLFRSLALQGVAHRFAPALRLAPVGLALMLSVASTGARESQRLPADARTAYALFPQIATAAERLGYDAYEHDDSIHVRLDDDTWIYFTVFHGEFRRTTEISDALRGKAKRRAQRRVDRAADEIWNLALDYRADLNDRPRRRARSRRRLHH